MSPTLFAEPAYRQASDKILDNIPILKIKPTRSDSITKNEKIQPLSWIFYIPSYFGFKRFAF
jgi:hypothetical protein